MSDTAAEIVAEAERLAGAAAPPDLDQLVPSVSETEIARYHQRMVKIYGTFDSWARCFPGKPKYATALSLIVAELEHEAFTPQGRTSAAAWLGAWPGTVADALTYLRAQEDLVRVALWQAATDGGWCILFDSIAFGLKIGRAHV